MPDKDTRFVGRSGVRASECMKVFPRIPGETGSAYAYRTLYYNILMLYMPPGSWIRESSIAQQLDLSRTPVHEAINLLRDRRLVDVAPQSATHVSCIDISTLRQGCFMRGAIEPLVFEQLKGAIVDPFRTRLLESLDAQREVASGMRPEDEYISLDNEFHRTVYEAADKDFVWEFVRKACAPYDRVRYMGVLFGYERPSVSDHEDLYHYLTLGGTQAQGTIADLVRAHLSGYVSYFDRLMADFPDYFVFHDDSAGLGAPLPIESL
jgi:DNA-binding GntR family transcriptional regulator